MGGVLKRTIMEQNMNNAMTRHLRLGVAMCATLALAACGAAQSVGNATVGAAKWAFTTQVKTMNLDLVGRSSLNTSGDGRSLSTVVRIYQLKKAQTFEQLDYAQLQTNDLDALKADLLGTTDVVLRPDANASISEPMNEAADYVAIVAFFRDTGRDTTWKLLLPKKQWKTSDPVEVEVRDSTLRLTGTSDSTITRQAPRQSAPPPSKADIKGTPARDDWARAG
jgi:type VI secretion system protein VasD